MSREHYDACFRYGIKSSPDEECNCYEFDRALEWVKPYLLAKLRDEFEGLKKHSPIRTDWERDFYNSALADVLALLEKVGE